MIFLNFKNHYRHFFKSFYFITIKEYILIGKAQRTNILFIILLWKHKFSYNFIKILYKNIIFSFFNSFNAQN